MNNTLVLTTTVLSATVAATLIALIFVFALCLTIGAVVLYRAGRRECDYRQRQVHELIADNEVATKAEARALWQRDSLVKSLDDAVSDMAAKDDQLKHWRSWAAYTDEVLTEAVNLADLCESQPFPAKAKNLMTASKLEALTRLRGAVEAYHVHSAEAGQEAEAALNHFQTGARLEPAQFDPEDFEAQLDDWAAQNAPMPETIFAAVRPQATEAPARVIVASEAPAAGAIKFGGRVAPPSKMQAVTNATLIKTGRA